MSTLRVATIGTWGHLGDPLTEIASMPDAKIVAHARAVADEDIAYVRKMSRQDSLPWFDDYHHMLREIRPDVVIVSTRIDRLNPIAIDVAGAGCHIICEKPLAMTHADLQNLHAATQARRVQCISMLGNSRQPVMQAAMGAIAAEKIGDVVLINARKSYKWGHRPEWFGDRNTYGGTICWVGIHGIEMIHLLSGKDFVSVSAMQSNRAHPDRPGCEDNGLLIFNLGGGGHASVSFDLLRPESAETHGDDWMRIVGSRGVIEASHDRGWCKLITEDAAEMDLPLPRRGAFYAPFLQGITAAAGEPMPEMRRAFMLSHVALVARDAADARSVKAIPSFYQQ
jgi:predicted dehydrogenase